MQNISPVAHNMMNSIVTQDRFMFNADTLIKVHSHQPAFCIPHRSRMNETEAPQTVCQCIRMPVSNVIHLLVSVQRRPARSTASTISRPRPASPPPFYSAHQPARKKTHIHCCSNVNQH